MWDFKSTILMAGIIHFWKQLLNGLLRDVYWEFVSSQTRNKTIIKPNNSKFWCNTLQKCWRQRLTDHSQVAGIINKKKTYLKYFVISVVHTEWLMNTDCDESNSNGKMRKL